MKKKAVVLRKCRSHRAGIVVFSISMITILTAYVLVLRTTAAILLYIPILVMLTPLTLYYLTWQIRFEEKEIIKSVFFRERKRYSFSMLREVVKRYYTSERNFMIRIYFADGKTIQFRMDDENAVKAEETLQRHCSIKIE